MGKVKQLWEEAVEDACQAYRDGQIDEPGLRNKLRALQLDETIIDNYIEAMDSMK